MQPLKKSGLIIRTLVAVSLLLQGSLSFADDTEIFLSRGAVNVKPNLFFILDDSLSMQWCLDWDWRYPQDANGNNRGKWNICRDGTYRNRWGELKEALNTLLSDKGVMKNVRFGMMWMNNRNGGYNKNNVGIPIDDIEKVRDKAINLIKNHKFPDALKTPIDRSLYDVARYFNGFDQNQHPTQKNFPGHSAKEAFKLNDAEDKKLPKPIEASCQPSHIMLLTDGDAWYDDIYPDTRELIGRDRGGNWRYWDKRARPCARQPGASSIYAEACVPELAEWLHTKDQSPLEGIQTVTTHVVALALNAVKDANPRKVSRRKVFLKNIAAAGGGNYYEADNGAELLKSFREILEQVADVNNATFVNPSAVASPTDTRVNDQVYYPLFRPTSNDRWPGNVKRYRFAAVDKMEGDQPVLENGKAVKEPAIVDANGKRAFNGSGDFAEDAQSFWSEETDGPNIAQGGAASKLPLPPQRKLYFSEGGDLALKKFSKAKVPDTLTANNVTQEQWKELFHYIRGEGDEFDEAAGNEGSDDNKTVVTDPKEGCVTKADGTKDCGGDAVIVEETGNKKRTLRNAIGDPLHSQPVAINYADGMQGLIFGTNEGFVHLLNRENGAEEFAFMPEALLKNIPKLHDNNRSTPAEPHPYGMDNTVTLWVEDKNNNNKVDTDETAYAYASMRRGGRNLYALDISDHKAPKLKWQIIGGSPGFEKLGQTWSQPVKTKILYNGQPTDVLIFGGGYDPAEDNLNETNSTYLNSVSMGNDIYIVDAISGAKLWSASTSGLDLGGRMKYSIPANISVVTNNEGLAEQIFAPDTGGQVWRFVINSDKKSNAFIKLGAENGVLARLSGEGSANARRFYHGAAVTSHNGGFAVTLGSGYRAHPLNTQSEDRFYALFAPAQGSETQPTLYESDLTDVPGVFSEKQQKGQEGITGAAQPVTAASPHGWYVKLQRKGEKVLSTPLVIRGEIFFNSYQPTLSDISCIMPLGSNYSYRLSLSNGSFLRAETLLNVNGIATTPLQLTIRLPIGDFVNGSRGSGSGDSDSGSGGVDNCFITGDGKGSFELCPSKDCNSNPNSSIKGCKTFWMDLTDSL